ncbi:magnesium-translocating P-type ATPase [Mizugakiibacter sediminis]|nr:magnesium-translocating P-type ATPase [Mizugakiibacter sediminis]
MLKLVSLMALIPERAHGRGRAAPSVAPEQQRRFLEIARLGADEALARLDSRTAGLDAAEAEARLERYGPNVVGNDRKDSILRELFVRAATPLNVLLLTLAVVTFFVDDKVAAGIMAGMVAMSVVLSYVQERRSDKAVEALREMVSNTATVRRQGEGDTAGRVELPIEDLVPGDVILLAAGDMLPADVRLLAAKDLFVNQSSLTGESMPVEKFAAADADAGAPLEARNLCFMGSNVVSGSALAVVVATGRDTCFGALAGALTAPRQATSFDIGVRRFAMLMLRFMAVMVPLVFVLNGWAKHDWLEAFLFAIAVSVGLAPEMLPMIVTINLAKGAMAMARKEVIVKRLPAIQDFGAIDVLCTDKTGTLTQDKVILERHVGADGEEDERVLQLAYLNSHYQTGLRNLLDVAVLERVEAEDAARMIADFALVDEVPFDFERRRMSVVVRDHDGRHLLVSKGAVAEMLGISVNVDVGGKVQPLTRERLDEVRRVARELNEDGFRVIAVGIRELSPTREAYGRDDERDLTLVGFMAFLDPPKDSAADAIQALQAHGIAVKILTGDNDIVARNVCRQVGLDVARVVTGPQIDRMDDGEMAAAAREAQLFARLNPQQKVRVIDALRAQGHVVGFMGDGINDGPALRAADVGISVDTAVDIAKASADIILLEKSLIVLEEGVQEGRKVFGNIIKYIKMTASSNFGNMLSVLGASALLPFLPMAPVQILLNNLMYDFSQTAVATDEVDEEYVARPRSWDMRAIARFVLCIGPISSLFDYATFGLMWYVFRVNDAAHAALFQTGWFVESLLSQTLIVHVIRTGRIPFVQSMASLPLRVATATICLVGMMLPFSAAASWFGFVPLPGGFWPYLAAIVLAYMALTQVAKGWLIRRFGLA